MAVCSLCKKEINKYIPCPLMENSDICLVCCFSLSSGNPDKLKKIKQQRNLYKDHVLEVCEKCLRERSGLQVPPGRESRGRGV